MPSMVQMLLITFLIQRVNQINITLVSLASWGGGIVIYATATNSNVLWVGKGHLQHSFSMYAYLNES